MSSWAAINMDLIIKILIVRLYYHLNNDTTLDCKFNIVELPYLCKILFSTIEPPYGAFTHIKHGISNSIAIMKSRYMNLVRPLHGLLLYFAC
jgi:hypothetical protein